MTESVNSTKLNSKELSLFDAICIYPNDNFETIEYIINDGADLSYQNQYGNTALSLALLKNGRVPVVELLIKSSINSHKYDIINHQNMYGQTPLMIACLKRLEVKIIEMLINAGADVNIQNTVTATKYGKNALLQSYSYDCAKLLLDVGANPFVSIYNFKYYREFGYHGRDEIDILLAEFAWKKLKDRDLDTARRYSKSCLNKDVWTIILMHVRLDKLKGLRDSSPFASTRKFKLLQLMALDVGCDENDTDNLNYQELWSLTSKQIGMPTNHGFKRMQKDKAAFQNIVRQLENLARQHGFSNMLTEEYRKMPESTFMCPQCGTEQDGAGIHIFTELQKLFEKF